MKKQIQILATAAMLLVVNFSFAQRYLEPVFTEAEITVTSDVVYGTNIDFLTSDLTASMQLATDLGTLSALADAGADFPAEYFNPADASTQIKVTNIGMDIYRPDASVDSETARPVIVYLHTGNFLPPPFNGSMMGAKTDSLAKDMCMAWARRGYVAVSADYRLGWNPIGDENTRRSTLLNAVYRALQDTKIAVRFLKTDAADANTYGIDPNKVALFGEGSGGYVAQAYTTLDNPSEELFIEKFLPDVFDPTVSYVDTLIVGLPSGVGYPNSLNLYRDTGVDSDVQMSINAGGALADESWLEAGDVPMVSFHAIRDDFAPFTEGTVIVPTTQEEVVDVHGSNFFIQKANDLGNNDVFAGLPDGDVYTDRARSMYDASFDASNGSTETVNATPEGLFPVQQPLQSFLTNISAPWQWWDPNAPLSQAEVAPGVTTHMAQLQSNPMMSEMQSMAYQDTINGYLLPRLTCALDLPGNPCGAANPANDAACDAMALMVDGVAVSTTNLDATPDGPQASCWSDNGVEGDVWYTFVAPASGAVDIETIDTGDNNDTQVAVYSSSDGTCTGTLTEVGCNDDISTTDYMSFAEVGGLTAGDTYWIQVDGWDGTFGAFDIVISEATTSAGPCDFGDIDNINMALICDDIEDYPAGGLNGLAAHWRSWGSDQAGAADELIVSTEQAFSGVNSVLVPEGGALDGLLLLGNQTAGNYATIWKMYIPAGKGGYFNIQNEETPGVQWNLDVFFNENGGAAGQGTFANLAETFTYPEDQWFTVVMDIDMDNDIMQLYINNEQVLTDQAYPDNLGAINFYSIDANNRYYIDDVAFGTDLALTVDELGNEVFGLFPNPSEGLVTLTSINEIESITVSNVLGAVLSRTNTITQGNIEVDLSALETGIYLVTVEIEGKLYTQRVMRK